MNCHAKVDVCIVAGRRPDLLATTLESFGALLFPRFQIEHFIVNIDPIFGGESEERACVDLINRYACAKVVINTPAEPHFTRAVIRNWSTSKADLVLHLEDDWLLRAAISPERIFPLFEPSNVAQVSFNTAEKNWDISARGNVHTKKRPVTLLGLKTPFKRRVPVFTTSPSFLRGDFARRCADLMDERFDPEKQFSSDVNPRLERFVSGYRNLLVGGGPDYLIVDTGRCWRDSRGITKSINNAVSTWEASRANAPD